MTAGDGDFLEMQPTRNGCRAVVFDTWDDNVSDMDSLMCFPTIMAATVVEHQQNTCQ
jgi:hypothetical protein